MNEITLFPDQQDIIDRVKASMRSGNKRVLIRAETGSGKTMMAAAILNGARDKKSKTWFTVPRKQLLRQTEMTYQRFDLQYGHIAAGEKYIRGRYNHICSLQTLAKRLDDVGFPDLAIIDECHYGGGQLDSVMKALIAKGSRVIGLTATPLLANGEGMDKWYQDMVNGPSMRELIQLGRLSDYDYYEAAAPDKSGLKMHDGDYTKQSLDDWQTVHGKYLVGNAINLYNKYLNGMRTIHFAHSVAASKAAAEAYTAAGIPAAHIDANTPDDLRAFFINKFADRIIKVLCNADLVTFGFDLAVQVGRSLTVEAMVDAAPTKSLAKQRQKWGRPLRFQAFNSGIIDLVGNSAEHGYPCSDIEWSLVGKEVKIKRDVEREVKMRQCKCGFCHPPAPVCPACGNPYEVQGRKIKEVDGEVKKIEKEAILAMKKEKRQEVGRVKTMDDLWKIANERGYKPQWVRIQAKIKGIRS